MFPNPPKVTPPPPPALVTLFPWSIAAITVLGERPEENGPNSVFPQPVSVHFKHCGVAGMGSACFPGRFSPSVCGLGVGGQATNGGKADGFLRPQSHAVSARV